MTIPFSHSSQMGLCMCRTLPKTFNVRIKSKLHTMTYKAARDLGSHCFCLVHLSPPPSLFKGPQQLQH